MQWDSSEKDGRLKAIPTGTHAPKSTPAVEEGPFDKRTACWVCPEVEGEPEVQGEFAGAADITRLMPRDQEACAFRPGWVT